MGSACTSYCLEVHVWTLVLPSIGKIRGMAMANEGTIPVAIKLALFITVARLNYPAFGLQHRQGLQERPCLSIFANREYRCSAVCEYLFPVGCQRRWRCWNVLGISNVRGDS